MSNQDTLLEKLQAAQVAKTIAETELLKEQTKQTKQATLRDNAKFLLRWTLVALALGGFVKLNLLKVLLNG